MEGIVLLATHVQVSAETGLAAGPAAALQLRGHCAAHVRVLPQPVSRLPRSSHLLTTSADNAVGFASRKIHPQNKTAVISLKI
jgi:hypothetical protein